MNNFVNHKVLVKKTILNNNKVAWKRKLRGQVK